MRAETRILQEKVVLTEELDMSDEQHGAVGGAHSKEQQELQHGHQHLVHCTAHHHHQHAVREVLHTIHLDLHFREL